MHVWKMFHNSLLQCLQRLNFSTPEYETEEQSLRMGCQISCTDSLCGHVRLYPPPSATRVPYGVDSIQR